MKIKVIVTIIALLIVIGCVLLKNKRKDIELTSSNIKSFYITYTNGNMANAYTRYELSNKDGIYYVKIKPHLIDEEDELEVEVKQEFVEKIILILSKYEVNTWDGFNKNDNNVLDGDSFSFSILFNDKSIHANGYMKWPNHFHDVVNEISPLFMNIYNEKKNIK